jgi:hypothetical protein
MFFRGELALTLWAAKGEKVTPAVSTTFIE